MADPAVHLTIDGRATTVPAGTTVFDAARTLGIPIPTLCHQSNMEPVGVCRECVVEIEGARVLAASCVRPAEEGMVVSTNSERVRRTRRMLIELLLSDHPRPCARHREFGDCELEVLAEREGITTPRFPGSPGPRRIDDSLPAIRVDHSACILCDRCIRACTDVKSNFVIGRMGKGYPTHIGFDNDLDMGASSCVSCGECMVSCPTGALTNTAAPATELTTGMKFGLDELLHIPIFRGVSSQFLEKNQGGVVKRNFRKGEILCREGEFGSTAFYILKGEVEVFLTAPLAHVKKAGGALGFMSKLTSLLAGGREDPRPDASRRPIPIDGPVDLPLDHPVAVLGEGELFGEMTCLNFYPRSATVRATGDGVVLEMLRNVLQILQKNREFKAQLERNYKQRALASHLRASPAFAGLGDDALDELKERAELIRFEPGGVICRQGEVADKFYLIRIGFVKVTQTHPGGEMVLAYLSRGQFFGEIGLLAGGVRTATCTALDHVEVVCIGVEDFNRMLERFPEVRRSLEQTARERVSANRQHLDAVRTVPLDDFLDQGLMEAQSLLLLDLEKCTRCDDCVRACASAHDGVTRLVRDGLRFDKYLVATSCRQCKDPLCMVGCPVGSIRRKESLEIIIEDWCIGCGLCADQCPYGNINMHPFRVMEQDPGGVASRKAVLRTKATACDLCTDHAEPSCVAACPHDAAHRVNPREFFARELVQISPAHGGAR
ncbi:MAG: cyclic nucleotide-binding domain-containing protein [Acidobacteria bacterium]|nr:cyclic nucleotide-binding domain-containing protein [Acidobacteriota bacterium]